MVLGELPVSGRPTIWMIIGQGPIGVAVGADGSCFDIFILLCPLSPLSTSLWETDGWMDDMRFYVLFNSISVISGQWKVDNERLCAVELRLWLRRFRLERGSNSVR